MSDLAMNNIFCRFFILDILILLFLFMQTGCHTQTPPVTSSRLAPFTLRPVSYSALPNWNKDHVAETWPAFLRSCNKLIRYQKWHAVCVQARNMQHPSDKAVRNFFETYFKPYQVKSGNHTEGLFTGYYEPEIHGSRTRSTRFNTAIYKRPDDLIMIEDLGIFRPDLKGIRIAGRSVRGSLKPYYTHEQINKGALSGNELIWIEDPVESFFIQVQGSASVKLDNGESIRLVYAGTNGHAYTAIGTVLVREHGVASRHISMQSIRDWLKAHPAKSQEILQQNASYVFFTEMKGEGPIGDHGVVLTPGRSLAVDTRYIPHGTPVWLDTNNVKRLVIAQDKGGAIKGPIRGDLFWGTGDKAGELAGSMKAKGGYFILLPEK